MSIDRFRIWFVLAAAAGGTTIAIGLGCGLATAESGSGSSGSAGGAASSSQGSSPAGSGSPKATSTPSNKRPHLVSTAAQRPKPRPSLRTSESSTDAQTSLSADNGTSTRATTLDSSLSQAFTAKAPKYMKPVARQKMPTSELAVNLRDGLTADPVAATDAAPSVTLRSLVKSTIPTMTAQAAPPSLSPIDVIGSLIFKTLNVLTKLFVGPPAVPPGSTVTLASSTLQVGDITVPADWYFPEGEPTGVIYLQHGSLAVPAMYSYTAAELAQETNSIVVAPEFSSTNFGTNGDWLGGTKLERAAAGLFAGNREELTESASLAAGQDVTLPENFVLVGHSLGGGFVTAMAGYMDAETRRNLKGVVLFDPVGASTDAMSTALAKIPDVPVMVMASPPYYWNQLNAAADAVVAARPGQFVGLVLDGGAHADYVQGANPLFQLVLSAITGGSQPQNVAAVQVLAGGWINDMFKDTPIVGTPGQPVPIPTDAGTATGIALPDNVHQPTLFNVLLTELINALTAPLSAL